MAGRFATWPTDRGWSVVPKSPRRRQASAADQVVYGRRAVAEAERGRRRVTRRWSLETGTSVEELTRLASSPDHQGVVAAVEPYPYADPTTLLGREDALVIALDQVQDPRNLGAVCRSAEVAGAAGVVIAKRRAAQVTATVAKTSAGAIEHLPIAHVTNLAEWLEAAKRCGAWVYGADADAEQSYDTLDYRGRVVIVLGGEGKGLRPRVAANCDSLVSIPRAGRVESLNVAAAAAVFSFEAIRSRRAAAEPI